MSQAIPTRVLTLFAHPDDETLAAGGALSRWARNGCEIYIAIPFTGAMSRRNTVAEDVLSAQAQTLRSDCGRALQALGVRPPHLHFGEFADNEADAHTLLQLVHWVQAVMAVVKPTLILTHVRDCLNIDHQYCHQAAVIAARPQPDYRPELWMGEIPGSTGVLQPATWSAQVYVELAERDVAAKLSAMECYASEVRPDPHPRSAAVLKALAKLRGSEAGCHWAEGFMLQRQVQGL